MGKGQLLLQPQAVLAAKTLCVSKNMVPAVGSAKGWSGSCPVSVPSPGRGHLGMACAPSLLPAVCSALAGCPWHWHLCGCSRTQLLGEGVQHLCTEEQEPMLPTELR